MRRRAAISEAFVARVWEQQSVGREPMVTAGGETVEVLHPGRPTNDCGPDFRDALIAINGGPPLQGDVELHVNARDWWEHGHHRDPNYNRVILHVAMQSNGVLHSPLCNGGRAPVVTIAPGLNGPTEGLPSGLCQPPFGEQSCYQAFLQYAADDVIQVVEEAGDERFRRRAKEFKAGLIDRQPNQVLYESLMRALGYSHNKESLERLARLLPLTVLEASAKAEDCVRIQALMLGTAGLLPSQRSMGNGVLDGPAVAEAVVEDLEGIWTRCGQSRIMNDSEWRFHGVRPENSPTRRIVAASHLLVRHQGSPLSGILPVINRLPLACIQEDLERSLRMRVGGYWASHSDFGAACGWRPALIGQSRARDVIVNVILPFCFAWSRVSDQEWLGDVSLSLYENHPELEENWITRHMKAKVFGHHATKMWSARRQQGLIELHEEFCVGHKCRECPLGGGHTACHGQPAGASDFLDAEGTE